MTLEHPVRSRPRLGEPTWEVAHLYPAQGDWTIQQYLDLDTNHLVEFDDGVLEFLPMPTEFHQCLMLFFYGVLNQFISKRGLGTVLTAPMKVRVASRRFREPDVLYMARKNAARRHNQIGAVPKPGDAGDQPGRPQTRLGRQT
jgi:Uma2 family endonuclease